MFSHLAGSEFDADSHASVPADLRMTLDRRFVRAVQRSGSVGDFQRDVGGGSERFDGMRAIRRLVERRARGAHDVRGAELPPSAPRWGSAWRMSEEFLDIRPVWTDGSFPRGASTARSGAA